MYDYRPKPVTRVELGRCLHHWWNPQVAAMEREREAAADVDDTDAAAAAADASAVDGGELPAQEPEIVMPAIVHAQRGFSAARAAEATRSAERRVGKACFRPCISRWSPYHSITKQQTTLRLFNRNNS